MLLVQVSMTGGDKMEASYFQDVVAGLSLDDLCLMGTLKDQDATDRFKAMQGDNLQRAVGLTEANYRKAMARMEAARMVERVSGIKPYRVYLTKWGLLALTTVKL